MRQPLFIMLCLALLWCGAVEAETRASVSAAGPTATFTVDIVGSDHFADTRIIRENLARAEGVEGVRVARANRRFTRLTGTLDGNPDHVLSDIRGLAQNRFSVEVVGKGSAHLLITLRKLGRRAGP